MRVFLIFFLCLNSDFLFGQNTFVLMEEGLRFEKEFKLAEALKKYEDILRKEPNHLQALIHASA